MTEATEIVRINSVSIEDNSRGTTAAVKAYGLTMQEAEDEAVASIQRLRERLKSISQLQSKAPELAQALIGLLSMINDHADEAHSFADPLPTEPIAYAYAVLAGAGVETT